MDTQGFGRADSGQSLQSLVVASSSYVGSTRRTTKVLDGRCGLHTGSHSPTQPTPVGFSSKSCGQLHR